MGVRLMAIVTQGIRERVYLPPTAEHEELANSVVPTWSPAGDVPARLTGGTCVPYGLTTWGDLFTPRQLIALTTFSDLVRPSSRSNPRRRRVHGCFGRHSPLLTLPVESVRDSLRRRGIGVSCRSRRASRSSDCSWSNAVHRWANQPKNELGRPACLADRRFQWSWDFAEVKSLQSGRVVISFENNLEGM